MPQNEVKDNFPKFAMNGKLGNDELISLFPIPLMVCPYGRDYSEELKWIRSVDSWRENKSGEGGQNLRYNTQSTDTFILDHPELKKIRTFIETKLNKLVSQIYGAEDKLTITQSWLNKNRKGESHHEHVHHNSIISGVWYPVIHDKLPPIQFRNRVQREVELSTERFNTFNSATFTLPLNPGELILFPSNLTHSVQPNLGDEERMSLSFNTWVKGNMGTIAALTYLPFDRLN